jgi:predicted nucleic acid-binding protein
MRVLVDTSVWSLALRRRDGPQSAVARELHHLIAARVVEIIGPIRQELLSGVRDPAHFARLEEHLAAFPDLPIMTEDHVTAAKFFNLCRSKGIQGSNTDFLICAISVRCDVAIFTTDGDFRQFAKYLPIVLHESGKHAEPTPGHHRRSAPKKEP